MCVCVRERERGGEWMTECVHVCVRDRDRQTDRGRERDSETVVEYA